MNQAPSPRKAERLVAVKGMNDILPPESARWEDLEARVRSLMRRYAYESIRTPIVEPTALFVRGLGEVTDIVEKEMYSFEDRLNGEQLTLRPENTAGLVRAVVEHNLLYNGGKRLFYIGPMFRHERPQRGRYRQFFQIGAEALGFAGPELDAELILMAHALWKELGMQGVQLHINNLGQPDERKLHRAALIAYFEQHDEVLDADSRRRLHLNPLRLLDSKNPAMQAVIEAAPRLMDFQGDASRAHLDAVLAILKANAVDYVINPRLVRGLDYYSHTAFEITSSQLGAQATVCGGGRYDGLVQQLGGPEAPAIGWALGMERLALLLAQGASSGAPAASPAVPDLYLVSRGEAAEAMALPVARQCRSAGLAVEIDTSGSAFGKQFKRADRSGARWAVVIGDQEAAEGVVVLKDLRAAAPASDLRLTPQELVGRLRPA
jgi:histidyl-tRNA synthetase